MLRNLKLQWENTTANRCHRVVFCSAGDIGYFDDSGHVFFVDRLKDVIKYQTMQVQRNSESASDCSALLASSIIFCESQKPPESSQIFKRKKPISFVLAFCTAGLPCGDRRSNLHASSGENGLCCGCGRREFRRGSFGLCHTEGRADGYRKRARRLGGR